MTLGVCDFMLVFVLGGGVRLRLSAGAEAAAANRSFSAAMCTFDAGGPLKDSRALYDGYNMYLFVKGARH